MEAPAGFALGGIRWCLGCGGAFVAFGTIWGHARVESGRAATASQILSQRPFPIRPEFARYYLEAYYPAIAGPDVHSGPRERPEGEIVAMLQAYLRRQFPGDTAAQADALRIYGSDVARNKVPSPTLRAAVTGLKGTFAEPAIDFLLSDRVSKIVFDYAHENQSLVEFYHRWATANVRNGKLEYFLQPENSGTYPFIFTAILAHEALHEDNRVAGAEEMIAKAVENWMIIQIASRHPDIMQTDKLSRRLISGAMILYNSGTGAHVGGLYQTNRDALIPPNSAHYARNWAHNAIKIYANWDTPTPGNNLLRQCMLNLGIPVQGTPDFSKDTLALFDRATGPRGMTQQDLVIAGRNLGLAVPVG